MLESLRWVSSGAQVACSVMASRTSDGSPVSASVFNAASDPRVAAREADQQPGTVVLFDAELDVEVPKEGAEGKEVRKKVAGSGIQDDHLELLDLLADLLQHAGNDVARVARVRQGKSDEPGKLRHQPQKVVVRLPVTPSSDRQALDVLKKAREDDDGKLGDAFRVPR